MSHEQVTAAHPPLPGRWWACCERIEKARVDTFELDLAEMYKAEEIEYGPAYARRAIVERVMGASMLAEVCLASDALRALLSELERRIQREFEDPLPEVARGNAS